MYIFTINTAKKEYSKYNNKQCWVVHQPFREDGFIEVYVPEEEAYILLRPSELED